MKISNVNRIYQAKMDGYKNLFAGIGGMQDKTQQTVFNSIPIIEDSELTDIWAGDGLPKKIVSAPADDMTKNWITISNDVDNLIEKEMMRLKSKSSFNLVEKWTRLYRGGIIVMGIRDGRKLHMPVNVNNIKGIDWLKVYGASRIQVSRDNIIHNQKSPFFEDVEFFNVRKNNFGNLKVHRSRCLVFKGEPLADSTSNIGTDGLYWGMSILQPNMDRIRNFGGIEQSIANMLYEFVIGKYKISNLEEMLAENKTQDILTRLNIIDKSKSIINAVLLGENEDYTRDSANVSGLSDLMDRFMIILSAVTEIPVTILWGRSPAGENATGEADLDRYYAMIKGKQEIQLLEPVQELALIINSYVNATTDIPVVTFKSPRIPTPSEQLEMDKKQADINKINVDSQIRTAETIQKEQYPDDDDAPVEGD